VVVVPLRIGGGTRLKIYEAMAAGRAVVSTSIGAEGLSVNPGNDILIADTPPAFAESVIGVLDDSAERRRLQEAASISASRFDWSAVARSFEQALDQTIAAAERERRRPEAFAAAT
jgi:glycosyltransferase involved in cell wall biosynthesis